jgi:hypothetical protein
MGKMSKVKMKKAKNIRKRAKKVAKRKAAGLCEHCGKTPCIKEAQAVPVETPAA